MSDRLLEVRDLRVDFDSRGDTIRAVRGASFGLERGESLGILGESGSGKSVSALALVGLLPATARATASACRLDGTDLLDISDTERASVRGKRIGFVFQDPLSALNPVMRIGRQIAEVLQLHLGSHGSELEERTMRWLRRVGISERRAVAAAYPHQLSGGMRQRVMIAVALAAEPELLIADEPTTALDVTVQAQILELVRRLRAELGMSLIWISHDLAVVAGVSDRVAVMRRGQIVEEGPVEEILRAPRHDYTRRLVALARANSVHGHPGASA